MGELASLLYLRYWILLSYIVHWLNRYTSFWTISPLGFFILFSCCGHVSVVVTWDGSHGQMMVGAKRPSLTCPGVSNLSDISRFKCQFLRIFSHLHIPPACHEAGSGDRFDLSSKPGDGGGLFWAGCRRVQIQSSPEHRGSHHWVEKCLESLSRLLPGLQHLPPPFSPASLQAQELKLLPLELGQGLAPAELIVHHHTVGQGALTNIHFQLISHRLCPAVNVFPKIWNDGMKKSLWAENSKKHSPLG